MAAKKYINEEISRLLSINRKCENLSSVSRNLNLLALQGSLAPVFHRENEVAAIQKLMLRRTKPNVLLTGPAGCGKTAIAEAIAIYIANQRAEWLSKVAQAERTYEKQCMKYEGVGSEPVKMEIPKPPLCDAVIYDLSMNSLVSGTRYRGDFEERLQKIMNDCKNNSDIILFIDEIHQINKIGDCENGGSMGQILKPALARAEIKVIGATTTEESDILKKDKALTRRFSEIEILPLYGANAVSTADSIMHDYEQFHNITVNNITAEQILEMVNYYIGGVFPNSFIDVIDETMSGAKFEGKTSIALSEIKATLSRMTGNTIL